MSSARAMLVQQFTSRQLKGPAVVGRGAAEDRFHRDPRSRFQEIPYFALLVPAGGQSVRKHCPETFPLPAEGRQHFLLSLVSPEGWHVRDRNSLCWSRVVVRDCLLVPGWHGGGDWAPVLDPMLGWWVWIVLKESCRCM